MKNYLFGLCCLLSTALWGQVVYAPVFINPCSGEEEEVTWFLGDTLENTYSAEEKNFEQISLPQTGSYQLYYNYPRPPITIEILQQGVNRDTILLEQLKLVHQAGHPPVSAYYSCDSMAEGSITTYYHNGQKRTMGTFEKGQPVDSTFFYYRNGLLKRLIVPSEKLGIRVDFYENGQKKHFYNFDQKILKDYYSNGQLKTSSETTKKGQTLLTNYYPSGQLKSKSDGKGCKRYSPKGSLKEEISLKISKIKKQRRSYQTTLYQYQWSSYDNNQALTRVVQYEIENYPLLPFPHHLKQVDSRHLEEIILYDKGNPTYKINFLYISEDHQPFQKKLFLHKREGKEWIQQQTAPAEEVYELLEQLQ